MAPHGTFRAKSAIRGASHTSIVVIQADIDRPTTLRGRGAHHARPEEIGVIDVFQMKHVAALCNQYGLHPSRLVTAEENSRNEDARPT